MAASLRLQLELDQALGLGDAPWGAPLAHGRGDGRAMSRAATADQHTSAKHSAGASAAKGNPRGSAMMRPPDPPRQATPASVSAHQPQIDFALEDTVPPDLMRAKLQLPLGPAPADREARMREIAVAADVALAPYLNQIATRVVFGEGDVNARLMFVGEGPGGEEDKLGRPFVGRSGQLLDKMIIAMGLTRESVYIANIVKLRSADLDESTGRLKDRIPTDAEVRRGIEFLDLQIETIAPAVIVTLGATALKYMLGRQENVSRVRGVWQAYRGIDLMPTFHPSFLLRAYTPENRAKVWSDLQAAMEKLRQKA